MNNQELARRIIDKISKNLFITGRRGKHHSDDKPKNMVVLAPTGVAAINAGGRNIICKT